MKYDNVRLKQMLAAEYALGTLTGAARRRFTRLLQTRADLLIELRYWEARFAPLLASSQPVPPRDIVWAEIERRIQRDTVTSLPTAVPTARPRSSLWIWQTWAVAASAAFVAVSLQLYQRQHAAPAAPPPVVAAKPPYVAMLSLNQGAAVWTVAMNPDQRRISVIARGDFGADTRKESMELWLIGDDGKPVALGIMPVTGRGSMPMPAGVTMPAKPVIAVSREPLGGSPTGLPTGPVLATSPVVAL
ncbi:anti-sigma factor [Solimonas marina]|uniref:Anti-sigma K factor RskA C-terminal domain-containing protein n=1 Tax=Solimonas marina TaxID=2714601 RepID=A0A969W970_9GAMM|nr:anti-sigma factor [Solimonas marina]NKF21241.1 hypothetical protein [Solimonas marina]